MKFRTDFVTNSSSSSFILGKKDDADVTIEYVYQIIRDLYFDLYRKCDAVEEYVKNNPTLGIYFDETSNDAYNSFKFTNGNYFDKNNSLIVKQIKRQFDFDIYGYIPKKLEWLNCKTYTDYVAYWKEKMSHNTDKTYIHGPFTIADFLDNKPVEWIHYFNKDGQYDSHHIDSKSDVLLWYYEEAKSAFENKECANCDLFDYCQKEDCNALKQRITNEHIPEDHACLYLLGRVCIYSECGYIPDYVIDKLYKLSEKACNHMG